MNYNRYTYAMNNPLKYTDPSGYTYKGSGKGFEDRHKRDEKGSPFYMTDRGFVLTPFNNQTMGVLNVTYVFTVDDKGNVTKGSIVDLGNGHTLDNTVTIEPDNDKDKDKDKDKDDGDDYIILNGKKIKWNNIETGTFNKLSYIANVIKVKLNHQQTLVYLQKMESLYGSVSENSSKIAFVFGLSAFLSRIAGPGFFIILQSESELHGEISNSYDQLSFKYNSLSERNGLWIISTRSTTISGGIAFQNYSSEFYLPNGQLFFNINW